MSDQNSQNGQSDQNGQDELRDLWNSQPPCAKSKGEEIMALVQNKIRQLDRVIYVRNWLECIAGGVVAVFFGWQALRAHDILMRIGFIVVAASAVWIIFYVMRYGQSSVYADPSQNVREYTRASVERYDHQIRLLQSVKYWYLLPMYVGLLIMSTGIFLQRARGGNLGWLDLAVPAFYTIIFATVWWLNESFAVRRLQVERAGLLAMADQN
jgi:hypothetical protein